MSKENVIIPILDCTLTQSDKLEDRLQRPQEIAHLKYTSQGLSGETVRGKIFSRFINALKFYVKLHETRNNSAGPISKRLNRGMSFYNTGS